MREYLEFRMKTIMVATDLSDASYGALSYAKQWAKHFSAKLLLVHVVDKIRNESSIEKSGARLSELIDAAEEQLQKVTSGLSYDDVRCTSIVRPGKIRETISDLIDERDVDLLVIGTRGNGYKDGEELGSVAETLLRFMPCPVLTVGKHTRGDACEATHTRVVLFPTDFSEISRAALTYTERLAEHLAGHLLLLHVDEQSAYGIQAAGHEDEFKKLLREMKDPSVVTECLTRAGHPADIVVSTSIARCVDFIVMGVHGTDQAKVARNYGMAYDVIRMARCPVFTLFTQPQKEMHESEIKNDHALLIQPS
jgi:nucleotide-binding universal stress UspA family protein